ncbi:hypothetical protein KQX54_001083 [Cotesia glomerata]|uniref:Uncharacterized protein n=1 Tax=Cotesia glomerata TaxID=32391 RepID=A0AAV7IH36_COTGL|nr:hypothetical protein KQX54_001083 [Cotesia glomerata]
MSCFFNNEGIKAYARRSHTKSFTRRKRLRLLPGEVFNNTCTNLSEEFEREKIHLRLTAFWHLHATANYLHQKHPPSSVFPLGSNNEDIVNPNLVVHPSSSTNKRHEHTNYGCPPMLTELKNEN